MIPEQSNAVCCTQRTRRFWSFDIPWGCMGCGPCDVGCCNCERGCCPDRRKRSESSIENDWSENSIRFFVAADHNHDGSIDFDEFVKYLIKHGSETPHLTFEVHFNKTDHNNDGLIQLDEFTKQIKLF
ncbi:unnamed protein product [Rotaria sp. Silwood2]|nr:unnamed protein product [Rotaria sp. Silwood2]CAF3154349.1 unnamed protein product [Rotaria sp. Silwood2]CAF4367930.1 unnamed protein product [Rotaria sp. Silwood2]CAF4445102.1 unnamed protein product [Rotaria sp. Silwood2]